MRKLAIAVTLAAAAALLPSAASAEDLPVVEVEVGTQKSLGPGAAPNCDDPGIAWISADGAGVLHGVKVGSTICSMMRGGGARRVYRIEVFAPKKKDLPKPPGGDAAPPGGPAPAGGSAPGGA
jgi:hypothetical protein